MKKKFYTKEQIKDKITKFDALNIGAMQSYMNYTKEYTMESMLGFMHGIYNKEVPDYITQMVKQIAVEMYKDKVLSNK